jgi:hypothetical protein
MCLSVCASVCCDLGGVRVERKERERMAALMQAGKMFYIRLCAHVCMCGKGGERAHVGVCGRTSEPFCKCTRDFWVVRECGCSRGQATGNRTIQAPHKPTTQGVVGEQIGVISHTLTRLL